MSQLVVRFSDVERWGCPSCGYRSGSVPIQCGGAGTWVCGECGKGCIALADGLDAVPKSWVNEGGLPVQPHPREGEPAHGRPDTRPEGGGEYFRPRGIGMDYGICFVCPKPEPKDERKTMLNNVAAFVQHKDAGDRIDLMFGHGAWVDYREREPDRIQVKVCACDEHLPCLEALYRATREKGVIKTGDVLRARVGKALGDPEPAT